MVSRWSDIIPLYSFTVAQTRSVVRDSPSRPSTADLDGRSERLRLVLGGRNLTDTKNDLVHPVRSERGLAGKRGVEEVRFTPRNGKKT